MTSQDPFRKLVKYLARAFYDEEFPPRGPSRSKGEKFDNRGIAVVILDALTRHQWVKEEILAAKLQLHPKQLRRTLKALEEELVVVRRHRKENVRATKRLKKLVASAVREGEEAEEEEEDEGAETKSKQHTHSYCALDYGQIYDVWRLRLHRAVTKVKEGMEDKDTVQHYKCSKEECGQKYTALEVDRCLDPLTMNFHCERCHAELEVESGGGGVGAGEDGAQRQSNRNRAADMHRRMQAQLEPLEKQLGIVKQLSFPPCPPLEEWERTATPFMRALAMEVGPPGGIKGSGTRGAAVPTPMPLAGETTVEAKLLEVVAGAGGEGVGGEGQAQQKVIPVWARTEAMDLTAQQRGEPPTGGTGEAEERDGGGGQGSAEEEAEKLRLQAYYEQYYAEIQKQAQMAGVAQEEAGVAQDQEQEQEPEWEDGGEGEEQETMWEDGDAVGAEDSEMVGEETVKGEELEWEEG